MDFKVIRQTIAQNGVIYAQNVEQSVDCEFNLPDYCQNIGRILKCQLTGRVGSAAVGAGNLNLEGMALVWILYVSDAGELCSYELPVVEDRWYNQPDTFDYKLHQLGTGSDTGMAVITPEYGGTLDGAYIDVWQSDSPYAVLGDTSISGQDAQRIYAAVQEDAQADRLLYFQIFSRDWEDKEEIGRIEFSFRGAETSADRERDGSSTHIEYCNVQIHSGMTSTLAVLADLAGAGNLEHDGPVDTVEAAA